MTPMDRAQRVLVVGNGMAGSRLAEELRERDPHAERFEITVVGEERHPAYNRVLLSTVVAGRLSPRGARLKPDGWWAARHIAVRTGTRVIAVDPGARTATLDDGDVLAWDELVLATGSEPFVPPMEGDTGPDAGIVTFRTIDDCQRISALAANARHVVVVGGGLLGLEAARGLLGTRVGVAIVHLSDVPMERQLDADGGAVLARVVRDLGATLHLGRCVTARRIRRDGAGTVVLDDGTALPADLVVLAAGVRPRVELARALGLDVNRAIVVDDRLATSMAHVHAIGECSEHRGTVPGLVQPGWDQARVLAEVIAGSGTEAAYEGTNVLTRLKVHDIDLTSMGIIDVDVHDEDHEVLAFTDPRRGRYAKLVLRGDRLVGAILLGVGDAAGPLIQLYDSGAIVPRDRLTLMLGRAVTRTGPSESPRLAEMPGGTVICRCNTVTKGDIVGAYRAGCHSVTAIADATRATTGCGGCSSAVDGLCSWLRTAEPREAPTSPLRPRAALGTRTEGAA